MVAAEFLILMTTASHQTMILRYMPDYKRWVTYHLVIHDNPKYSLPSLLHLTFFFKKNLPLDGQTRRPKSTSQLINLPGAWP